MKTTFNNWYDKKMRATKELSEETDLAENLLSEIKTIAVVGLSRSFHKDSQFVARYLQNASYTIIPVNPGAEEILGQKAWPDLKSIPVKVDAVDVFLPPEILPNAVDQAVEIRPKAIWLQLGTGKNPEQKKKADTAGIPLFENRCIKVDHQFLVRPKKESNNQ